MTEQDGDSFEESQKEYKRKASREIIDHTLYRLENWRHQTEKQLLKTFLKDSELFQNLELIQAIISSEIRYYISKTEYYEELIIECIFGLPRRIRISIIEQFIYIIKVHSASAIPSISPTTNEPYQIILPDFDSEFAFKFYLKMYVRICERILISDSDSLSLFSKLISDDDLEVQSIAIELMYNFVPISIEQSFQMIQLLLFYLNSLALHKDRLDSIQSSDFDPYFVAIFQTSYSNIPKFQCLLLGRKLLYYLHLFDFFVDWNILNHILDCIHEFVVFDHTHAQLVSSIFLNLFPMFHANTSFINICRSIASSNDKFKRHIWKKYSDNFLYLPSLLSIAPYQNKIDIQQLKAVKFKLLYSILIHFDPIPPELESCLRQSLSIVPPSIEQLPHFFPYLPTMPCEHYSVELICRILELDETQIRTNYQPLKEIATKTNSIDLISILYEKHQDESFYEVLVESVNELTLWKNPHYRNVMSHIILQYHKKNDDVFTTAFRNSKIQLLYYMSKERKLWKSFFLAVLDEIVNGIMKTPEKEIQYYSAISLLHQIDCFLEMYDNYSFLFFEKILVLLKDHDGILVNLLRYFFDKNVQSFSNVIIPILIKKKDLDGICHIYKLINPKGRFKQPPEKAAIHELVLQNNINNVFYYLLGYNEQSTIKDGLLYLGTITGKQPTHLLKRCIKRLAPKLVLNLGFEDEQIRQNARKGIEVAVQTLHPTEFQKSECLKIFWTYYYWPIIIEFINISHDKSSFQHEFVLRSLNNNAKYIEIFLKNCYTNFFTIINISLQTPKLRPLAVKVLHTIVHSINTPSLFTMIFLQLLSHILPYYKEFEKKIHDILTVLIIKNEAYTESFFGEIAYFPLFKTEEKLKDIYECIQNNINKQGKNDQTDWANTFEVLSTKLENASEPLRHLLIQQILTTLREHEKEIDSIPQQSIKILITNLRTTLIHETNTDYIYYCAQCLSFLPYFHDLNVKKEPNVKRKLWIITIIKDYLVKILERPSIRSSVEHASYAIQELLKKQYPSIHFTDDDFDDFWANCQDFTNEVKNIISPYFHTSLFPSQIEEDPKISFNENYIITLTRYLLSKIDPTSEYAYLTILQYVIDYSFPLCKFILPHFMKKCFKKNDILVFKHGKTNLYSFLRKEWLMVCNHLHDFDQFELSKQICIVFFSIFDVLPLESIPIDSTSESPIFIATHKEMADAALKCELYFRALNHIEMMIKQCPEMLPSYQKSLLAIFEHVGDPDSLEFLQNHRPLHDAEDKSLIKYEISTFNPNGSPLNKFEFAQQLLKKGHYEHAFSEAIKIKNLVSNTLFVDSLIARASVRLQKWDEIDRLHLPNDFHVNESQYVIDILTARLLYFKRQNDMVNFEKMKEKFKETMVPMIQSIQMFPYFQLVPLLIQIRLVDDITTCDDKLIEFDDWGKHYSTMIEDIENVVAVRSSLAGLFGKKSLITSQWLHLARECRKNNDLQTSKTFCSRAMTFDQSKLSTIACLLEKSKIEWQMNQQNIAILLLNQISAEYISNNHESFTEQEKEIYAKVKYLLATWSSANSSSDNETIKATYKDSYSLHETAKAFLGLASLSHEYARSILEYSQETTNADADLRKQPVEPSVSTKPLRNALGGPPTQAMRDKAAQKTGDMLQQVRKQREADNKKIIDSKFWTMSYPRFDQYKSFVSLIKEALKSYFLAMNLSPQYSYEVIPRLLQLIFDFAKLLISDQEMDLFRFQTFQKSKNFNEIIQIILMNFTIVPKYVWLNSLTQLISRIDQPSSLFEVISSFIKPAIEHYPELAFWHLMQLRHIANKQPQYDKLMSTIKASLTNQNHKLICDLELKYSTITSKLLTLIDIDKKKCVKLKFADIPEIPDLKDVFQDCGVVLPLATSFSVKFDSNDYVKTIPRIQSMVDKINVLGTLQVPKKITFEATDGNKYSYLIKKDDDLRKDMRMMEFASFINRLLQHDRRSRKRDLSVTTFTVICLDEFHGMIEWVNNLDTLQYCVNQMWGKKNLLNGIKEKVKILQNTEHHLDQYFVNDLMPITPPVLHLYFAENFKNRISWFQVQLRFTRSCAIWSMIGFIVGLGDRHANNFMINKNTGEVVHVDFSMLFDRGKSLPRPENVPFRLTRNVVDGMGILGTDGAFSASATLTLSILREKKDKILSVLQTLVHDPFIDWAYENKQSQAKMILREVDRRLSGVFKGQYTERSPDLVVQELIKAATNTSNLAHMFLGWEPYL